LLPGSVWVSEFPIKVKDHVVDNLPACLAGANLGHVTYSIGFTLSSTVITALSIPRRLFCTAVTI